MTQVVEVPLEDGGAILIEVAEVFNAPTVRGGRGGAAVPTVKEPLEEILAGLGPATRAILGAVRALADSPHEIEVEFAVKLTADARMMIARAGAEANFRIALKWMSSSRSEPNGAPAGTRGPD